MKTNTTRLVALAALLAAVGCTGTGTGNTLTGKVTLKGKAVAGSLTFIDPDGKELPPVPINPDGTYTAKNLPAGALTVLVKPLPGVATMRVTPPKNVVLPGNLPTGPAVLGVAPPMRYATPAGRLQVQVTGGSQTHDLPLGP